MPVEDILDPGAIDDEQAAAHLAGVGFADRETALRRIRGWCAEPFGACSDALRECLPMLLSTLSTTAQPDVSLVNFERYLQSVPDRTELLHYLCRNPRAIEILIRLFVGSQYLTGILLRNPGYLAKLVAHKRLADVKSRPQFIEEGRSAAEGLVELPERFDAYRRFQQWELLRIGACDSFGLMNLKSVVVQLSLLTDSLVQNCLDDIADGLDLDVDNFVVIGMGKLGGEELNYSSDIDLIFLTRTDASAYWRLGQKLIKALMDKTSEGFLYRVDMRLRPWGQSGALVNTVASHLQYLEKHGMLWELQALLKARPVAGNPEIGREFLKGAEPLIFGRPAEAIRENIRKMKSQIEEKLLKEGKEWGEVKGGQGSIRDIEFVTQYLQLRYGGQYRSVSAIGTQASLARLAERGLLEPDEYRELSSGYVFLRTIEHALQLMHHKQVHVMPDDPGELDYLARRLDYPSKEMFLQRYEQCRRAIRSIYSKYIEGADSETVPDQPLTARDIFRHAPSYQTVFEPQAIVLHEKLLSRVGEEVPVVCHVEPLVQNPSTGGTLHELTIAGDDAPGLLSLICGLLSAMGCNIVNGYVFTGREEAGSSSAVGGRLIDVFTVETPAGADSRAIWSEYEEQLVRLAKLLHTGEEREARGELADFVGSRIRRDDGASETLFPIEIEIDNGVSDHCTRLTITSVDTVGFLYELANALAMSGIDIRRVVIATEEQGEGESEAARVVDVLDVTDREGRKLTDPQKLNELRTTVALIKQVTHLLPHSPQPRQALRAFRELLEQLLQQPGWTAELTRLDRSDVLDRLVRLLGVSEFLWDDFLKLQHDNLFPLVADRERLTRPKSKADLEQELESELRDVSDPEERRATLNAFKDREMFRIDMRHILSETRTAADANGREPFEQFGHELTDLAETVVEGGLRLCLESMIERFGTPRLADGSECRWSMVALGKCGGRELGFASDIELMLIYEDDGRTDGGESIVTAEFFPKLVERFSHVIDSRREGIFQIDLRLRPYGDAGSLAVTLRTFEDYFSPSGPAWPYERQALVKLRPIAGDQDFGTAVVRLRDRVVYQETRFDTNAMRAMREKQVRQLVEGGTFNAKLSDGGLVDVEYLVQGMQIRHGVNHPGLRTTNTLEGVQALRALGFLSDSDADGLRDAYIFLRRLIDALRVVRGHAKDLAVPDASDDGFLFLARRLEYETAAGLQADLDQHTETVRRIFKQITSRL